MTGPRRLRDRLLRKTKVEISCPHGVFIPGVHRRRASRYSCDACGFHVKLSDFRGDVSW